MKEEIVAQINDLLKFQRHMLTELDDLKKSVERHVDGVRGSKTAGVIVGVLGICAAPFTGGLSLIPAAAVSGVTGIGASIGDAVRIKEFGGKVDKIAAMNSEPLKKLQDTLQKLEKRIAKLAKEWNITEAEAAGLILSGTAVAFDATGGIVRLAAPKMGAKVGAKIGARLGEKAGGRIGAKAGGQLGAKVAGNFGRRAGEWGAKAGGKAGAEVVGKVAGKAGGQLGAKAGVTVLKAAAKGLVVVGILIDAGDMIHGWASKHPSMTQIDELVKQMNDSIETLEGMEEIFLLG